MSSVKLVTEDNFDEVVFGSPHPVLVDFFASWCPPCRLIAPVMDSLAERFADTARIVKVNVDENQTLARRFRVESVPALVFFRDGQEVNRIVGAANEDVLVTRLTEVISGSSPVDA